MIAALLLTMVAQATPPRDLPRRSASLTGAIGGVVVTDETQPRPVRRARVTLTGASSDAGSTAITGDDGVFVFADVAPGRYSVTAQKDAYVTVANGSWRAAANGQRVTLVAGERQRLEFRLARGAVITGTVLDVDGTPMQGVDVRAYERHFFGVTGEYRYLDAGAVSLVTDDRGVYRIFGLPPGDYFVAAGPPPPTDGAASQVRMAGRDGRRYRLSRVFYPSSVDAARAAPIVVRAGEERSGIDVQLQYVPLASISGMLVVPPGRGAAEIAIAPILEAGSPALGTTGAIVDDAGHFTFANVPPGTYRLTARNTSGSGTLAASIDVTLDGDDLDGVTLSLQPTLAINGMVVFRGDTPAPVFGRSTSAPPLAAAVHEGAMPGMDLDGVRFRIQGIVPGPFRLGTNILGLRAPLDAWWLTSITAGDVQLLDAPIAAVKDIDGAIATFSDRVSTIAGVVSDAVSRPHPYAQVIAFSRDRGAWFFQSWRVAAASTDDAGRYVIRNLPPGDYLLAVALDLVPLEWYDPAVLERLAAGARPFTVMGAETQAQDLVIR